MHSLVESATGLPWLENSVGAAVGAGLGCARLLGGALAWRA